MAVFTSEALSTVKKKEMEDTFSLTVTSTTGNSSRINSMAQDATIMKSQAKHT